MFPSLKFHSLFALPLLLFILPLLAAYSPANSPPVAVNDSYNRHGSGTIGPLLANDYDPDNDAMAVNLLTFPAHGSLQAGSGSLFTYTLSDPSWTGTDTFTYQACDSISGCGNTATVTINVVNNGPVAIADFYVVRGWTTIGPLRANDYDIDGDTLSAPDLVTFPAHGTLYGQTNPDLLTRGHIQILL